MIREAVMGDYLGFKKVHKDAWIFHQKHLEWRYQNVQNYSLSEGDYEKLLDTYKILLAEKEGMIVGIILLKIERERANGLFKERNCMYVSNLGVLNEYRKNGIGESLMKKAEEFATGNKLSEIYFDVRGFNDGATNFYEKLGYSTYSHCMRKELV